MKDRHAFKTEMDAEARRHMFPHLAAQPDGDVGTPSGMKAEPPVKSSTYLEAFAATVVGRQKRVLGDPLGWGVSV